jgi:hypothetical protein
MARSFDGTNDSVSINSALVTVPFTFACWVKVASGPTDNTAAMSMGRTGSAAHLHWLTLGYEGNPSAPRVRMCAIAGGSTAAAVSTTGLTFNTWHHICGIAYATNSRAAFLNGGSKGTNSTTVNPTSMGQMIIGAMRYNGTLEEYFNGLIAIPAIWDVALTDDEVLSLAQGTRPDLVRPESLVSYQLFDPRILDIQGHAWTNSGSTDSFDDPPLR